MQPLHQKQHNFVVNMRVDFITPQVKDILALEIAAWGYDPYDIPDSNMWQRNSPGDEISAPWLQNA